MVDLAKDGKTQEEVLDALRILPLVSAYASCENPRFMVDPRVCTTASRYEARRHLAAVQVARYHFRLYLQLE